MLEVLAALSRPPLAGLALDLGILLIPFAIGSLLALLLLLLAVLFVVRVLRTLRLLYTSARRGRQISAAESGPHPLTNFSRSGAPSDPLNIKVIATASQLPAAFAAAGWYRADEIELITSIRISVDTLLRRKYATAPVSNLYLFGRHQDFAFERPGSSVRERDHVRFWETSEKASDGRPLWIGGATKDIGVEIPRGRYLPTHKIAPDVDTERATVAHDLTETGWVIAQNWEPGFGKRTKSKNAMGDAYHTDGQIAVLTLADVPVLIPIATNVRGPFSGLARVVGRLLRWRLPKIGREHARAAKKADAAPTGEQQTDQTEQAEEPINEQVSATPSDAE